MSRDRDMRGWLRFKPLMGWGIAIRNGRERKAMICTVFYLTKRELYEAEPSIRDRKEAVIIKVRIAAGWKS